MNPTPPQPTLSDGPPTPLQQVLRSTDLPLEDVYAAVTHASPVEVRRVFATMRLAHMLDSTPAGEPPTILDDASRRTALRGFASRLRADHLDAALDVLSPQVMAVNMTAYAGLSIAVSNVTQGLRLGCSAHHTGNSSDRVALVDAYLGQLLRDMASLDPQADLDALLTMIHDLARASERNHDHHRRAVTVVEALPELTETRWPEEQAFLAELRWSRSQVRDPHGPVPLPITKAPLPLYKYVGLL